MPWYQVIKTIRGRRYLYWQMTYRERGKVKTRNKYIGPANEQSVGAAGHSPSIPKEPKPLAAEARKYGSAGEFVNAQLAAEKPVKMYRTSKTGTKWKNIKDFTYFAPDKEYIKQYLRDGDTIVEYDLKPSQLVEDAGGLEYRYLPDPRNPKIAQLIDIYNKVKGGTPTGGPPFLYRTTHDSVVGSVELIADKASQAGERNSTQPQSQYDRTVAEHRRAMAGPKAESPFTMTIGDYLDIPKGDEKKEADKQRREYEHDRYGPLKERKARQEKKIRAAKRNAKATGATNAFLGQAINRLKGK
jgi:hypothetical protein